MKVAINKCYGGFSPSDALFEILIDKGWDVTTYNDDGYCVNPNSRLVDRGKSDFGFSRYSFAGDRDEVQLRTNPDLVEAIEVLGDAASGICGKLRIVEVPDDVEITIEDYDGFERIAEVRRTWG